MIHIDFLKDIDQSLISEPSAVSKLELTLEDFERMARYSESTLTPDSLLRQLTQTSELMRSQEELLRELVREAESKFDREALLREVIKKRIIDPAQVLAESVVGNMTRLSTPALDAMIDAGKLITGIDDLYRSALPNFDAGMLVTGIGDAYRSALPNLDAGMLVENMTRLSIPALDAMIDAGMLLTGRDDLYRYRGGAIPWDLERNIPGVSYTPKLPEILPPTPYTPSYTPSRPSGGAIGPFRGPMSQIKKVEAFMLAIGVSFDSPLLKGYTLEHMLILAEEYENNGIVNFSLVPTTPQLGMPIVGIDRRQPQMPTQAPTPGARNQDAIWQKWFHYYHTMHDLGYRLTWKRITLLINEIAKATYSPGTVRNTHSWICERCIMEKL